jgi:hypothetical protein
MIELRIDETIEDSFNRTVEEISQEFHDTTIGFDEYNRKLFLASIDKVFWDELDPILKSAQK